jgi:hypothetical protein
VQKKILFKEPPKLQKYKNSPKFTFGSKLPDVSKTIMPQQGRDSPSPIKYNPKINYISNKKPSPSFLFGGKKKTQRFKYVNENQHIPLQYYNKSDFPFIKHPTVPSIGLGSKSRTIPQKSKEFPGPGAYQLLTSNSIESKVK